MKKVLLGAAALVGAMATPANAAAILVEGGGTPVIYEQNGNRFVLLGIDARGSAIGSGEVTVDAAYVNSLITSGPELLNLFACTNGMNCTPNASISVSPGERLFDSLLGEFDGLDRVVINNSGRTQTIGAGLPTQPGSPPIVAQAAVPEPATWVMLLLGFFAIGASMRSKIATKVGALKTA
ncbi:MAG: PEPxxWA-CTERM sorting domain-containing protein [Erythrobacter sp.]|jgi:hypothetical protein|nr:PEPxxWA-CTERM sorting domain-containing protein [Erythrobacter sp.]